MMGSPSGSCWPARGEPSGTSTWYDSGVALVAVAACAPAKPGRKRAAASASRRAADSIMVGFLGVGAPGSREDRYWRQLDRSVRNWQIPPMARAKEFDRAAALDPAIAVFASHGFAGASTEMLLQAMRISRQSMYDTFGDKHALF